MRVKLKWMLCCVGAAACAASETGNPVADSELALTARSSNDDVIVGDTANTTAPIVQEAWVTLRDIRFVRGSDCNSGRDEQEDRIAGPTVVELVAKPQPLALPSGDASYCRVRVPLDRAQSVPAAAPSELKDAAIVVSGERADGTPFVIRSRQKRELELRSHDQPFELASKQGSLILAFDVGRWLQAVDLSSVAPDSSGVIRIDDDHERALLDVFERDVRASLELFRDHDHDGSLDDEDEGDSLASED